MKPIIHVDQHAIRANKKDGGRRPVISVKTYKSNTKCHSVTVDGPSEIVYSPDQPLSCGARVWVVTRSKVTCR